MRTLSVIEAGTVPYGLALEWQRDLHQRRVLGRIPDVVLLLEHPHVYTLGRRFSAEHLLLDKETLRRRGIEIHEADRGGSITYHGPGQLVGYPIVALQDPPSASLNASGSLRALQVNGSKGANGSSGSSGSSGDDTHRPGPDAIVYLRTLEEAIIRAVRGFGVHAGRREGLTGVWVGPPGAEQKLASIGVNVTRGVTKHGFALNVTSDLSYFGGMVPCGLPAVQVTSLERLLGEAPSMQVVRYAVVVHLAAILGARVRMSSLAAVGLEPPPPPTEASIAAGLPGVTISEEPRILSFPR